MNDHARHIHLAAVKACSNCYQSHFNGTWWCDRCDTWPCHCKDDE